MSGDVESQVQHTKSAFKVICFLFVFLFEDLSKASLLPNQEFMKIHYAKVPFQRPLCLHGLYSIHFVLC